MPDYAIKPEKFLPAHAETLPRRSAILREFLTNP
jgi:hypothetical protein